MGVVLSQRQKAFVACYHIVVRDGMELVGGFASMKQESSAYTCIIAIAERQLGAKSIISCEGGWCSVGYLEWHLIHIAR